MTDYHSGLVTALADRSGLTRRDIERTLSALEGVLVEALHSGKAVKVNGLLTVERVERAARTGRNPRTGETIAIPARHAVKITAGGALKKAVAR